MEPIPLPALPSRRRFLKQASILTAGLAAQPLLCLRGAESPSNKVVVGVMGTSRNSIGGDGRGTELAVGLASSPGVEVAYICDVDSRNVPKAIESVVSKGQQKRPPKGVSDFRRILEDKTVDALVIAAPDHWHAPAAILACAAGQHVYVEKPCSHNPREGELLAAAARKHKRLIQHGTQRRSWPALIEAVHRVRSGELGRILFAKSWYYGPRPTVGTGAQVEVPSWLDYKLWQGPAPRKPYRDNVVHYNWHWFWHWGTGELGNNGVHTIDVCRWAAGLEYPRRVTSSGGKYRYPNDDQETPDTNVVSFDFGETTLSWEQRSWASRTLLDPKPEIILHGEKGVMAIHGGSYTLHDLQGKELSRSSAHGGNQGHLENFIHSIRGSQTLNAPIDEGVKSTLLCHLGNIAYRTGHAVHLDPATHRIRGDAEAASLWDREYEPGWEPKV